MTGSRVTIRGICTGGNGENDFNGTGYIENSAGGPRSGVAVFGSPSVFNKGNDVTITGFVSEFQHKTELSNIQNVIINAFVTLPDPPVSVVTAAAIAAGDSANTPFNKAALSTGEQWEGVLVKVVGATTSVGADTMGFGQWFMIQGSDSCLFDDNTDRFFATIHNGQTLTSQGVCDWVFNVYRVQPRDSSDFSGYTGVSDGHPKVGFTLAASPNPMHGSGRFDFALPKAGDVSLQVFDTRGRLVSNLIDRAPFNPGRYTMQWSGKDDAGARVASGVYLYRLSSGGNTISHRLVWSE